MGVGGWGVQREREKERAEKKGGANRSNSPDEGMRDTSPFGKRERGCAVQ